MHGSFLILTATVISSAFAICPTGEQILKRQAQSGVSTTGTTGGSPEAWQAPGPSDSRGPCPGLNTLANHGYLPRNGRGITLDKLTAGMKDGFNINAGDARLLFSQAVRTNSPPSSSSFNLDTLGRQGVLEHDISLSRSDRYFANPLPFNASVWAWTSQFFPDDMISVQQLADARMGRLNQSKTENPDYSLSSLADGFSWGECASFFEIMADGTTGTVAKRFINYWLTTERLPYEIGWQRRTQEMQGSEREDYSNRLRQAAGVSGPALPGSGTGKEGLLGGLGGGLGSFTH